MHFKGVISIFKAVALRNGLVGQLSFLTHRDKTDTKAIGHHSTKHKAPGINTHHLVKILVLIAVVEDITRITKCYGVLHQCSQIPENNAIYGPVRNASDVLLQIHFVLFLLIYSYFLGLSQRVDRPGQPLAVICETALMNSCLTLSAFLLNTDKISSQVTGAS